MGHPRSFFVLRTLQPGDAPLLRAMQARFHEAFEGPGDGAADPPGAAYLESLLASGSFVAIAALKGDSVVGGLTAYEIVLSGRPAKEFYLYDLAVSEEHRRQGIATAMIRELQSLAARRGASGIFVQAHSVDAPAVALYSKLGSREEVLHFDLPLRP